MTTKTSAERCAACGAMLSSDTTRYCPACALEMALGEDELLPGSRRAFEDYELIDELGRGGQGVVYRARQKSLNRIVALKVIALGPWATEDHLKRFRLEAEAAARLDHSGVVPIYEVGERDGCCFFSMKLMEGGALDLALKKQPITERAAAEMLLTLARTVQFAHEHGVLHRDIKPANILLDHEGRPHLTDFGLAKLLEGEGSVTRSMDVMGTPSYMAPEQAAGRTRETTTATDVYALGAVGFELLTGQPPFTGESSSEVIEQVLHREPRRISALNANVSRDLETICLKCLEKEPLRRYSSAQALADDLERFLRGDVILARQVSTAEKTVRWCRRNPALAVSFAASITLLVAIAIGSSIAALRIQRESTQRGQAERDAKEKLWSSYLAQARAHRLSGLAGRRAEGMTAVSAAAQMKSSLELRNEAIALLALTDIRRPVLHHERDPGTTFNAAAPFPDFKRYVVFHESGRGVIHEMHSGRVLQEFNAPTHLGARVRFSPTGRYLAATFMNSQMTMWDTSDLNHARTNFPRVASSGQPAAFTSDEQMMVVPARNGQLQFHETATGKELFRIDVGAQASRVDFDVTGRYLACNPGSVAQIWDVATRRKIAALNRGVNCWSLAWHPSGNHLAIGLEDGEVLLWDARGGEPRVFAAHNLNISHVSFDPGGEILLSQSWDGTTRFWGAWSGELLFSGTRTVAWNFSTDGTKISYELDPGTLGTWELERSAVYRTLQGAGQRGHSLRGATFSPDSRWIAVGHSSGFSIFETASARKVTDVPAKDHPYPMFHPEGGSIITIHTESVQRWSFAVVSNIPTVGAPDVLLSAPAAELQHGELSADGEMLAVAGHHRSFVMSLDNPQNVTRLARRMRQSFASISPDKQHVALASYYGVGVTVWNTRTGQQIQHLVTNDNARIRFSTDGGTLITGTAREFLGWDTRTWQRRFTRRLDMPGHVGISVAAGSLGRMMAAAPSRREIMIFDPQTGTESFTLTPPQSENFDHIAFSLDGRYLAGATMSQTVQVWDLQALRRELALLKLAW